LTEKFSRKTTSPDSRFTTMRHCWPDLSLPSRSRDHLAAGRSGLFPGRFIVLKFDTSFWYSLSPCVIAIK
jgi:hypothetical protein